MLTVKQLQSSKILVPHEGGEIALVDQFDKAEMKIGLTSGIHQGKDILKDLPSNWEVKAGPGVNILVANFQRATPMTMGHRSTQSGANPDYRPSSAATQEKRLRMMMDKIDRKADRLDQRLRSLDNLAKRQAQHSEDDLKVIDDETQPMVDTEEPAEQPPVAE